MAGIIYKGENYSKGVVGPTGPAGPIGPQGDKGDDGPQGPIGATGAQGPAGPTGATGATGPRGPMGEHGEPFVMGGEVLTYADLPDDLGPADVAVGYVVRADGKLYVYDGTDFPADGDGVSFVGRTGPQGAAGPIGPRGPVGPAGRIGDTGPRGPQGEKGDAGSIGAQGPRGTRGEKGDTGDTGLEGPRGLQGEKGDVGPQGVGGLAGKSVYDIAKDGGFTGTEAEFLDSLKGKDGVSPEINTNGVWEVDGVDTGVEAQGPKGDEGEPGLTPHIDRVSKHWIIGQEDTDVIAEGLPGSNEYLKIYDTEDITDPGLEGRMTLETTVITDPQDTDGQMLNIVTKDLANNATPIQNVQINGKTLGVYWDKLEIKNNENDDSHIVQLTNGPYDLVQTAVIECYNHIYCFDKTTVGKGLIIDTITWDIAEHTDLGIKAYDGLININHVIDTENRDVCFIISSTRLTTDNSGTLTDLNENALFIIYNEDQWDNSWGVFQDYRVVQIPAATVIGQYGAGQANPIRPLKNWNNINLITDITRDLTPDANGYVLQRNNFRDPSKPVLHSIYGKMLAAEGAPPSNEVLMNLCLETGYFSFLTQASPWSWATCSTTFNITLDQNMPNEWESQPYEGDDPASFQNTPEFYQTGQIEYGINRSIGIKTGENRLYDDLIIETPNAFDLSYGELRGDLHGTIIWGYDADGAYGQLVVTWPDGQMAAFPASSITRAGACTIWGSAYNYMDMIPMCVQTGPWAGYRLLNYYSTSSTAIASTQIIIYPYNPLLPTQPRIMFRTNNPNEQSFNGNTTEIINGNADAATSYGMRCIGNRWFFLSYRQGATYIRRYAWYVNESELGQFDTWGTKTIVQKSHILDAGSTVIDPNDPMYCGGSGNASGTFDFGHLENLYRWDETADGYNGTPKGWLYKGIYNATCIMFIPDDITIKPYAIPTYNNGSLNGFYGAHGDMTATESSNANEFIRFVNGHACFSTYTKFISVLILYCDQVGLDGVPRWKQVDIKDTVEASSGYAYKIGKYIAIPRYHTTAANNSVLWIDSETRQTYRALSPVVLGASDSNFQPLSIVATKSAADDTSTITYSDKLYVFRRDTTSTQYIKSQLKDEITSWNTNISINIPGTGYNQDDQINFTLPNNATGTADIDVSHDYTHQFMIGDGGEGYEVGDTLIGSDSKVFTITEVDLGDGHIVNFTDRNYTNNSSTAVTLTDDNVHGSGAIISDSPITNDHYTLKNAIISGTISENDTALSIVTTGGSGSGMTINSNIAGVHTLSASCTFYGTPQSGTITNIIASPMEKRILLCYSSNNVYQIVLEQALFLNFATQVNYRTWYRIDAAKNESANGCWLSVPSGAATTKVATWIWNSTLSNYVMTEFTVPSGMYSRLYWNKEDPSGAQNYFLTVAQGTTSTNGNYMLHIRRRPGAIAIDGQDVSLDAYTDIRAFGRTKEQTAAGAGTIASKLSDYNYPLECWGRDTRGDLAFKWTGQRNANYAQVNKSVISTRTGKIRFGAFNKTIDGSSYYPCSYYMQYSNPEVYHFTDDPNLDSITRLFNTTTLYYSPVMRKGVAFHKNDKELSTNSVWSSKPVGTIYRSGSTCGTGLKLHHTTNSYQYNLTFENEVVASPVTGRTSGAFAQEWFTTGTTPAIYNASSQAGTTINSYGALKAVGLEYEQPGTFLFKNISSTRTPMRIIDLDNRPMYAAIAATSYWTTANYTTTLCPNINNNQALANTFGRINMPTKGSFRRINNQRPYDFESWIDVANNNLIATKYDGVTLVPPFTSAVKDTYEWTGPYLSESNKTAMIPTRPDTNALAIVWDNVTCEIRVFKMNGFNERPQRAAFSGNVLNVWSATKHYTIDTDTGTIEDVSVTLPPNANAKATFEFGVDTVLSFEPQYANQLRQFAVQVLTIFYDQQPHNPVKLVNSKLEGRTTAEHIITSDIKSNAIETQSLKIGGWELRIG